MKHLVLALSAVLLAVPALAQVTDSTSVIEASGVGFTKAEFEEIIKGDSRYQGVINSPSGKRALANDFGKAFALEAEARRRKIDQTPSMQLKIRHAAQQLLAYELVLQLRRDYLKDEVALTAQYEKSKELYAQPRVRQILVRVKGSEIPLRKGGREMSPDFARSHALALRAKLVAGADFASLAKAESDDLGTRERGGDLGFINRGANVAALESAAFSMPIGKLSDVLQSELGFHIIRVEERKPQPLSQVKQIIANDLAHRDIDALVLSGYKINESYFAQ